MLACIFQEHYKRTSQNMKNRVSASQTDQQQQQQQSKQPSPPDHQHFRVSFPSFPPQNPLSFLTSSIRATNGNSSSTYSSYSPPKRAAPPSSAHEAFGGNEMSPISSSWQEVQMIDGSVPPFSEAEDPVVEEQTYHDKQCK